MSEPTVRECPICPSYVVRCWHVSGVVVWMANEQHNKPERIKRGVRNIAKNKVVCPQCGDVYSLRRSNFAVLGPGKVESPICPCRYGLAVPRNKAYMTAYFNTEAEAIAEGWRRIRELT